MVFGGAKELGASAKCRIHGEHALRQKTTGTCPSCDNCKYCDKTKPGCELYHIALKDSLDFAQEQGQGPAKKIRANPSREASSDNKNYSLKAGDAAFSSALNEHENAFEGGRQVGGLLSGLSKEQRNLLDQVAQLFDLQDINELDPNLEDNELPDKTVRKLNKLYSLVKYLTEFVHPKNGAALMTLLKLKNFKPSAAVSNLVELYVRATLLSDRKLLLATLCNSTDQATVKWLVRKVATSADDISAEDITKNKHIFHIGKAKFNTHRGYYRYFLEHKKMPESSYSTQFTEEILLEALKHIKSKSTSGYDKGKWVVKKVGSTKVTLPVMQIDQLKKELYADYKLAHPVKKDRLGRTFYYRLVSFSSSKNFAKNCLSNQFVSVIRAYQHIQQHLKILKGVMAKVCVNFYSTRKLESCSETLHFSLRSQQIDGVVIKLSMINLLGILKIQPFEAISIAQLKHFASIRDFNIIWAQDCHTKLISNQKLVNWLQND
jgi:hypothetical protein